MWRILSVCLLSSGLLLSSGCDPKDPGVVDDTGTPVQDVDGDGYDTNQDCDDDDPQVHPGAVEVCDEKDNDCDGEVDEDVETVWYPDIDGDGWGDEEEAIVGCDQPSGTVAEPGDCDDDDPETYPGADERCDGVDNDCDGEVDNDPVEVWYVDADGDGYGNAEYSQNACDPGAGWVSNASDCDDIDPAVHPDAAELCNGIDDDCDSLVDDDDDDIADQSTWYLDGDADGYGLEDDSTQACEQPSGYAELPGDCDDADAAYNPGADESDCADPNDYNCDGSVGYADVDGDGWAACEECDDADADQYPGADELCNGEDDDCDGTVDEDDAIDVATWYADTDADGFGDSAVTAFACDAPSGYVSDATDCDDNDAAQYPGADEVCNGEDDDCDGDVDEDDAIDVLTWYADVDGDGYGDPLATDIDCDAPRGYVADDTDCDDTDAAQHPGADERCNGEDDDCDGDVDEDDAIDVLTWYADVDGDGYGDALNTDIDCDAPSGYIANDSDCDDSDAGQFPGADELCNGEDDDCDGTVDEDDAIDAATWYADVDGDGYGDVGSTSVACDAPSGYVADDSDCDDGDAAQHPGADELCNGEDDDCDGSTDEDDALDVGTWYADVDGDGYGDPASTTLDCELPSGFVADDSDCDDSDASINPSASEACDGVDNDCDGTVDEDDATDAATWYADDDNDGYGDPAVSAVACEAPSGYLADGTDCDDNDDDVHPGATELCNGFDDDCDGTVDEDDAADVATWYADVDGDGYGDAATTDIDCDAPSGYIADDSDCDDADPTINPAATEACDGVDNDCDGLVDDDDSAVAGQSTWYLDYDGDGYGEATSSDQACDQPSGYVADATDCDDRDASAYPSAGEYCDGVDNDCDGAVDEDDALDASTWYADVDSDGYGDAASSSDACGTPSGYVSDATDCDDGDASVNPGATEVCNSVDDDCDGAVDEDDAADATTWYADGDSDGYGDASDSDIACDAPSGYVADDSDCDDGDSTINPAATEICDSVDNDCDGLVDDDDSGVSGQSTWYADMDGDGYGDPTTTTDACDQPSGYLTDDSDCDDGDSAVNPAAGEICNGVDDDCDGDVDDDDADVTGLSTWYLDADGDGYGDASDSVEACFAPTNYVADASDCDDDDASVWEDCNPFRTFDGTFASTWETLTYPSGGIRGFQSYHSEDDWDVIYHLQNTTNSYYDPSTDTWTTMSASAPYGSYWAGLAPWDGLLWSVRNSAVYSYDPATDTWTTVASTSWSDDQGMTVVDEDGVLYGYDASGNIAVYDTATGTQTSYPTGLGSQYETRMGYDPITRAVYFAAFHVYAFYKFDIATGAVSALTAHPEGMLNDIYCSDNSGHIYAAGSSSGTTMWQYDVATDTWSAIPDLPSDHGNNHSCVVSDSGWLYVGGSSGFYRLALY
jgi:hypothetical protein